MTKRIMEYECESSDDLSWAFEDMESDATIQKVVEDTMRKGMFAFLLLCYLFSALSV